MISNHLIIIQEDFSKSFQSSFEHFYDVLMTSSPWSVFWFLFNFEWIKNWPQVANTIVPSFFQCYQIRFSWSYETTIYICAGVCVGVYTVLRVHMNSRLLQIYFSQLYLPHLFIWRWQHSGSIRKAKRVLDNNFIIFIQIII